MLKSRFYQNALLTVVLSLGLGLKSVGAAHEKGSAHTLELHLKTAILLALKSNLPLQSQRLLPQISRLELDAIWSEFGLVLGANSGLNQNISPSTSSFIDGASILNQTRQNYQASLAQNLPTGGQVELSFDNQVTHTNSIRADLNPAIVPQLALDLRQPLLRNALNGFRRLEIGENSVYSAQLELKAQVIQTVADVQNTYWDLVRQQERLRVQRQALSILQDLLLMNREKEKAGFMSKIDVLQTEARIADRQTDLLDAERQLKNTEDQLKRLLNPQAAQGWTWDSAIQPLDKPSFQKMEAAFDTSYQTALARRPDFLQLELALKNAELRQTIAGQNLLPTLDLTSRAGLESLNESYPVALGQLFGFQTYFWNIGLRFEFPVIGNALLVAYEQASLEYQRQDLNRQAAQQRLFQEIRQSLRNMTINAERVKASQMARQLAEEQLKAQTEKLNLGLTTNFQVLQFQTDFESASLSEVNAIIDYIQAVNSLKEAEGTLLDYYGLVWEENK